MATHKNINLIKETPKTLFDKVAERSITNTIEMVTPEKAAFWLQTANTHNRPLSIFIVKRYGQMMKAGKWRENTSEPISFTPDGMLVDGQHRLAAVVESCTPVRMTINLNADADDFKVIDTGKKRSAADAIAVFGAKNYTETSAAIIYYLALKDAGIIAPSIIYKKYGVDDILEEFNQDRDVWKRIAAFSKSCAKRSSGILRSQIVGGVYAFLLKVKGYKNEVIETFFNEVATGATEYTAIRLLHFHLIQKKGKRDHETTLYIVKSLARAWNHFLTGNKTTQIRVSKTDIIAFN